MNKIIRIIILAMVCAGAFFIGYSIPVLGDNPDPDSVSVSMRHVNVNLLEEDDACIYFVHDIDYTVAPSSSVEDLFTIQLVSANGTNILASREPYAYVDDGYGPHPCSFYFSAADNLTLGEAYIIRIVGKPEAFDDPSTYDFVMAAADYTAFTTRENNQVELYTNIISMAEYLSGTMSVTLTEEIETGKSFSSYGETLFRAAVPGIQAMCPTLFQIMIYSPNYTPRDWTGAQSDNYSGQYEGTKEQGAVTGFWTIMFNINSSLAWGIPVIIVCILLIVFSLKTTDRAHSGILNSASCLIIASPAGWIPMAIISVGALLSAFYTSIRLFLKG